MAKNDYDVICFKILIYLYACMQREIAFDEAVFKKEVGFENLPEEYFVDVLRLLQEEGYIRNAIFQKAWGMDYILLSDLSELEITASGIRYLKDNPKMKEVMEMIRAGIGLAASLAKMVFPLIV